MILPTVKDVRKHFINELAAERFVTDKTGVKTIELVGASFIADEPTIFGPVNEEYVARELAWYRSRSLYVKDIPGGPPRIWQQVASKSGLINSNYGWCIWDDANYNQYTKVRNELLYQPNSRRAVMIYNRPTMHEDYAYNGMSDFMCTNAVQYLIRDNKLHAVVQMRSNDVVYGFRNDYAWQKYVLGMLVSDLNLNRAATAFFDAGGSSVDLYDEGDIIWNAGSLHVYERHFNLIK